jgi:hypothetical protein
VLRDDGDVFEKTFLKFLLRRVLEHVFAVKQIQLYEAIAWESKHDDPELSLLEQQ